MATRQNHLLVAALMTLVGVLLAVFGKEQAEASIASDLPSQKARNSDFSGDRDLNADPYRLWLAGKYEVQRNEVFDRFVIAENTFKSLDDALGYAHEIEEKGIAEKLAEQERIEAEAASIEEDQRLASEKAEAEWQETKPKMVAGAILVGALAVVAFFIFRESPEEKVARLAAEEASRMELVAAIEEKIGTPIPTDATEAELTENTGDDAFLCDEESTGTVLSFKTDLTKKEVRDHFAKALGAGRLAYDFELDGNFDWIWRKDGSRYILSMLSDDIPTHAYFCVVS